MNLRELLPTLLLGLLGIVAAAGISLAANEVSGGEIALSADPVFEVADERLVDPGERVNKRGKDWGEGVAAVTFDDDGGSSSEDLSGSGGEDRSGSDRDPPDADEVDEPEIDNSGSGSDSSGSGSSGSGSSGSGSGGNSGPGGGDD